MRESLILLFYFRRLFQMEDLSDTVSFYYDTSEFQVLMKIVYHHHHHFFVIIRIIITIIIMIIIIISGDNLFTCAAVCVTAP